MKRQTYLGDRSRVEEEVPQDEGNGSGQEDGEELTGGGEVEGVGVGHDHEQNEEQEDHGTSKMSHSAQVRFLQAPWTPRTRHRGRVKQELLGDVRDVVLNGTPRPAGPHFKAVD